MAHKHNRRRIRHRSRRNRYEQNLPTLYEIPSYDALSSMASPSLSCSSMQSCCPSLNYTDGIDVHRWRGPQHTYERSPSPDLHGSVNEARIIQYYGGEPGEDWNWDMADNMQKMFDSIGITT